MAITVEAVYENGTLKLEKVLPLAPHTKVRVTVHTAAEEDRVQKAYGLLGWTGDSETVQRVALDPEFGAQEGSYI
jgi:predicted DNA-binding antitoxin AbrB/MazE fold protein